MQDTIITLGALFAVGFLLQYGIVRNTLLLLLALSLLGLVGCGRYLGDSYYYHNQAGVLVSCREPKAYLGGNCKIDSEWEDGGLSNGS